MSINNDELMPEVVFHNLVDGMENIYHPSGVLVIPRVGDYWSMNDDSLDDISTEYVVRKVSWNYGVGGLDDVVVRVYLGQAE